MREQVNYFSIIFFKFTFICAISVFLSNLDFSTDEVAIREILSSSGDIVDVRLVKNSAGRSKGFAYVEFTSQSQAKFVFHYLRLEVLG